MRLLIVVLLGALVVAIVASDDAPVRSSASRSEIEMTPAMAAATGALIERAGYQCPAAKLAFAKGPGAEGDVIKVFCGPAGSAGVYPALEYRLTGRADGSWLVEPW